MFCQNCGTNNPDGANICSNCGAPMQQPQQPQQPTYQQPVYQQPMYQAPFQQPKVPGKGLGIASLVLGIVSLVFFCYYYLSIPCSIIGAVLGGVGISKAKSVNAKNGLATAGLVCSVIALALAVILIIWALAVIGEISSDLDRMF